MKPTSLVAIGLGLLLSVVAACSSDEEPSGSGTAGTGGALGAGGSGGGVPQDSSTNDAGGGPNLDAARELIANPECSGFCSSLNAAGCENGPASITDCIRGCDELTAGRCGSQMRALIECAGVNPSVSCDAASKSPVVMGCDAEATAVGTCTSSDGGSRDGG